MAGRRATIDHDEVREWVESRGGRPAVKRFSWNGQSGVLRVDFGDPEQEIEEIPWEDFLRIFDEQELAFLCRDETTIGTQSRFFRFIARAKIARGGGNGHADDA